MLCVGPTVGTLVGAADFADIHFVNVPPNPLLPKLRRFVSVLTSIRVNFWAVADGR